jgi:hypothetical protein
VLRNSVLVGYQKGGFAVESKGSWDDYITNGVSEFANNLVHAVAEPYYTDSATARIFATKTYPGNPMSSADQKAMRQDAAAALKAKAEANGSITYADAAAIMLENPFYSTTPNFLPKAGSPALSGASFAGMNSFFGTTTYRGAMGTNDWTTGWTNWDPQNASY